MSFNIFNIPNILKLRSIVKKMVDILATNVEKYESTNFENKQKNQIVSDIKNITQTLSKLNKIKITDNNVDKLLTSKDKEIIDLALNRLK